MVFQDGGVNSCIDHFFLNKTSQVQNKQFQKFVDQSILWTGFTETHSSTLVYRILSVLSFPSYVSYSQVIRA